MISRFLLCFSFAALSSGPVLAATSDKTDSPTSHPIVRVTSAIQNWRTGQPWEKSQPFYRGSVGVVLEGGKILTSAEMVTNAVHIEIKDVQDIKSIPARIVTIDYGANLALLEAVTDKGSKSFIDAITPAEIADPIKIGDPVDIVQVESNGEEVITNGRLQGVDMLANFARGEYLLSYQLKASLQSASDSFAVPAFSGSKFLGLLCSYSSDDQLSTIVSQETVSHFLADAADGDYQGFPIAGLSAGPLDDPNLREWLKIDESTGGLFVSTIKSDSPAEKSGLKKGDVITAVRGYNLDVLGYYKDERYGRLYWTHILRGKSKSGENVPFEIIRDGKPQTIQVKLAPLKSLPNQVPRHLYDKAPNYLVKGGMIFQELSYPLLQSFGSDWRSKAPLKLLRIADKPDEEHKERKRIVILTAVIPTPATVGYDRLRYTIVEEVNGKTIGSIADLDAAFSQPALETHSIKLDSKPETIYLNAKLSDSIDQQLKQRGLAKLKRTDNK